MSVKLLVSNGDRPQVHPSYVSTSGLLCLFGLALGRKEATYITADLSPLHEKCHWNQGFGLSYPWSASWSHVCAAHHFLHHTSPRVWFPLYTGKKICVHVLSQFYKKIPWYQVTHSYFTWWFALNFLSCCTCFHTIHTTHIYSLDQLHWHWEFVRSEEYQAPTQT